MPRNKTENYALCQIRIYFFLKDEVSISELQGFMILNPEQKEHSGRALATADKPLKPAVPPPAPLSHRGRLLSRCLAVAKADIY